MVTIFVWVIIAALLVGAAKGIIQGKGLEKDAARNTFVAVGCVYVALIAWLQPWESTGDGVSSEQNGALLAEAMAACDGQAKASLNVPMSADFSLIGTDRGIREGAAYIHRKFTAKNKIGAELPHSYSCVYRNGTVERFKIES